MLRSALLGILSIFWTLISGCAVVVPASDHKADWSFQVAAPRHYDVWVEHLQFELSGVRHWSHPAGSIGCCWQGDHGPKGISGRLELFPDYVAIQWFSYAERKFYQRLISIPSEWEEKMKEPVPYTTSLGTFEGPRDSLTFGLAPGGQIVVWIMNQIGNEVELARFQANEIEGDPSTFKQTIESYMKRSGDHLKEHGIPLEGW
jgi:hypothetical protein